VGELKKSRRNRGDLRGDFHGGEVNIFANYAFAFASRLRFLPADFLARKGIKDLAALCCEGVGIQKETEWLTLGLCRARDRVTIDQ
jgi:hypothetical protein